MKFGFESEKLLFDLNENTIFHGVFSLVDALSDYVSLHGLDVQRKVTNEFVLNMVEMNTLASPRQREVLEDYLLLYQIVKDVSRRENVVPLPFSAVPFEFTPSMVPKWPYYVQNSILSGKRLKQWGLAADSPLADAGNCAGLHVHFEIDTLPEYLGFTDELVHKYNLALMLTPMVAFSASPYFGFRHEAHSMRCKRYHFGVYKNYPLNGGISPVFDTSEEVLRYTMAGIQNWCAIGHTAGFKVEDMRSLTRKKGAYWGMVRWNRSWNTVELRAHESDRIDYDLGKFVWSTGALKRLDLKGEALKPKVAHALGVLDEKAVEEAFTVRGHEVSILSTAALHALVQRATIAGLKDPLVVRYLERLADFAKVGVDEDCRPIFELLAESLRTRESTSALFLSRSQSAPVLDLEQGRGILHQFVTEDQHALERLREHFPDVIPKSKSGIFPSFKK